MKLAPAILALSAAWALPAWGQGMAARGVKAAARGEPSGLPWNAKFTDVAAESGLTTPTVYGGVESEDYILEGSSGGVALLDYDGDGRLDIFIVGGTRFGGAPREAGNRLYRNQGDGTFEDVTAAAGLKYVGWCSSVAVGDYDNDGHLDLFVTSWGPNLLYRNTGRGGFEEVSEAAGLRYEFDRGHPRWGAGATFVDYDRDGYLDLFVSNYADFDLAKVPKPSVNRFCNWKGEPVPCGPRGLPTDRPHLYRNRGDGTFEDVSEQAGVAGATNCFGMTVAAADFDGDGRQDVYVACDSTPALLFHNQGDGAFREEGLERGAALSDDGEEQAGMGVAVGDYDLDGRLDLLKTHFSDDMPALYRNVGEGYFEETTLAAGLGVETRFTGWGVGFPDFDNDGVPDALIVTGNVFAGLEKRLPSYPHRTPRLLFRGLGDGRFEQILDGAGPALNERRSSRGAAFGDIDDDGDIDVVIWNRNEPPSLWRNDLAGDNHWIQVRLEGVRSNRAAVGARVTARYGSRVQVQTVLSQASFYSVNDLRLHFGLGKAERVDLEINWPSGEMELIRAVDADQVVVIREGEGARAGDRWTAPEK